MKFSFLFYHQIYALKKIVVIVGPFLHDALTKIYIHLDPLPPGYTAKLEAVSFVSAELAL